MITFSTELKVVDVQERSITKRTGEPFKIVEYVLEAKDKKQTVIVARAMEGITLNVGYTYECHVGIGSNKTDSGRIFTNFLVLDAKQLNADYIIKEEPKEPEYIGEEIPF